MPRTCPKCRLTCPDGSTRCACGHDLTAARFSWGLALLVALLLLVLFGRPYLDRWVKGEQAKTQFTMAFNQGLSAARARDWQTADDAFSEAIRVAPTQDATTARAHTWRGIARSGLEKYAEAMDDFDVAIQLNQEDGLAHRSRGLVYSKKGEWDRAVADFDEAIRLSPEDARAYHNRGIAYFRKKEHDKAIADYTQAIRLDPKNARAHNNLGLVLEGRGKVGEALAHYRKALTLDPKNAWTPTRLPTAERLAAVEPKLPSVLEGKHQPGGSEECLALAQLCQLQRRYRASAELYAGAFAADPKVADDLKAAHRYNAACYAALAAAGKGEGADKLIEKEKSRLRAQALSWLGADLALRTKQLGSSKPADRAEVQAKMRHWQQDADLAGVRDAALATLPEAERAGWRKLWEGVAALLSKANGAR